MTSLPDALHTAIRAPHHQLDHHPLLAPLVREPLTTESYARALSALHGAQSLLESQASCGLVNFKLDYPFMARLSALEADLARLGERPLPCRATRPPLRHSAELIGLLYVLEGSRMGATVIARCLQRSLPTVTPRFFQAISGHAPLVTFWPFAQMHCLESDIPIAANYAADTFSFLLTHLDDCLAQTAMAPATTLAPAPA